MEGGWPSAEGEREGSKERRKEGTMEGKTRQGKRRVRREGNGREGKGREGSEGKGRAGKGPKGREGSEGKQMGVSASMHQLIALGPSILYHLPPRAAKQSRDDDPIDDRDDVAPIDKRHETFLNAANGGMAWGDVGQYLFLTSSFCVMQLSSGDKRKASVLEDAARGASGACLPTACNSQQAV